METQPDDVTPRRVVLFATLDNAGRSQIAEAFFNRLADPRKATGVSAGMYPASRVQSGVIEAMREVGVDLASRVPRRLDPDLASSASLLITIGSSEPVETLGGLHRVEWSVADARDADVDQVRAIRDAIHDLVRALVVAEGFAAL